VAFDRRSAGRGRRELRSDLAHHAGLARRLGRDDLDAARRERGVEWLTRAIVQRANFKTWLIDTFGTEPAGSPSSPVTGPRRSRLAAGRAIMVTSAS